MVRPWLYAIPGKEARSLFFHTLEDRVQAASRLALVGAFGVSELPLSALSLREGQVQIAQVSGVTPGGDPVVVGGADPAAQVPLIAKLPAGEYQDLHVRTRVLDRESALRLEIEPAERSAPPPRLDAERLYLGRYRVDSADRSLQLEARPLCARLDAIRSRDPATPWGAEWEMWIQPLWEVLTNFERSGRAQVESNPSDLVRMCGYLSAVERLLDRFAELPWTVLARDLVGLARCGKRLREGAWAPTPASRSWVPTDAGGDGQVRSLLAACDLSPPSQTPWRWSLGTARAVLEGRWDGTALEVWRLPDRALPVGCLRLRLAARPLALQAHLAEPMQVVALPVSESAQDRAWIARLDWARTSLELAGRRVRILGIQARERQDVEFLVS